ncbi:GH39 family glycosyl hydrolase [Humibacter ginsengisoli]
MQLIRSYDWVSRLDTRDNPESLFPDWNADPSDPNSYNFAATDHWVNAVHSIGADVLFNFASAIPSNKLPAMDVEKYGRVVEHIVRHYADGWANGPEKPIRMYEFGDQPDFGPLHFTGTATEFFSMYEAFCAAVKRVDPALIVGGPSLGFPLNAGTSFRESFLAFVRDNGLPLDFFSFLWFADATRDPMDFRFVAAEMRRLLNSYGFTKTELMLSYWNYLGIPNSEAPLNEKAAFQAVSEIYLQDTAVDYALFFRADSGADPHYGFTDPAAVCGPDGSPDARTVTFGWMGRVFSGHRLAVDGGDEAGFACAASIDGDRIRILIANFVAPEIALAPRESDECKFRVPLGAERIELGFRLPPQRTGLASRCVTSARVHLTNLPWAGRVVSIAEQSLNREQRAAYREGVSDSGSIDLDVQIDLQSVVLIELSVS